MDSALEKAMTAEPDVLEPLPLSPWLTSRRRLACRDEQRARR